MPRIKNRVKDIAAHFPEDKRGNSNVGTALMRQRPSAEIPAQGQLTKWVELGLCHQLAAILLCKFGGRNDRGGSKDTGKYVEDAFCLVIGDLHVVACGIEHAVREDCEWQG